jgi:extracellular factor (EF) 3-hydroxypalmitic acid methyl ester biosynthesis protein
LGTSGSLGMSAKTCPHYGLNATWKKSARDSALFADFATGLGILHIRCSVIHEFSGSGGPSLRNIMSAVSALSHHRLAVANPAVAARPPIAEREAELTGLLDRTCQLLFESNAEHERVGGAIDGLFQGLSWQKTNSSDEEWEACIRRCRAHHLREFIHEDPFTCRAFKKPRGYAGDAELLDMIYGPEERWPEPAASPLGTSIYRYTSAAPAAEGVRARRGFIADLIDRLAGEMPGLSILAVAAGHLREASLSAAVRRRRIGRFVALDADPVSLQEVNRAYGSCGVETVVAPFSHLITGRAQPGKFDLVYSTGLFDYLSDSTGRRLVRTLFDMLKAGGQLVVANFLPGIRDVGFMEAYMDWRLIYRTRRGMVEVTMEIDESELRDLTLFTEENRNIIFARLTKC